MYRYIFVIFTIFIISCSTDPGESQVRDQCLRNKIYNECISAFDKHISSFKEEDKKQKTIQTIMTKCADEAYNQSFRIRKVVKKECVSG